MSFKAIRENKIFAKISGFTVTTPQTITLPPPYLSCYTIQHRNVVSIHDDAGSQWLSGRVFDSRPRGRFEPHRRHCVVSLSKNTNPSLVLVQPRKTRQFIIERLLMARKESNQTNKHDDVRLNLLSSLNSTLHH